MTLTPEQIETLRKAFYSSLNHDQQNWEKQPIQRMYLISKRCGRQIGATTYIAIKNLLRAAEGHRINIFCTSRDAALCVKDLVSEYVRKHTGVELQKRENRGNTLHINSGCLRFLSARSIKTCAGFDGDVVIDDSNWIDNLNEVVFLAMYSIAINRGDTITLVI